MDASRRNSLPPLSAAATVQAPPPVQCVRSRRAFVCRRRPQGHPPGPPQLAGQGLSRRKGFPSTRCCFGRLFGRGSECPPWTVGREGRQSAEGSGRRRVGRHLSVSVSCRTRSRRPTPSRPAPGRRVKGKDFKIRGRGTSASALFGSCLGKEHGSTPGQAPVCVRKAVYQRFGAPAGPSCQRKGLQDKGALYVGLCFIRLSSSEKAALNVGTGPFVPIMKLCSTLHAASVCEGKPCINASGPRPGRRVKGKDCRIRGRGTSASALFGSRLRKKYVSNAGCFLFGQNTRASTPERTFNCKG